MAAPPTDDRPAKRKSAKVRSAKVGHESVSETPTFLDFDAVEKDFRTAHAAYAIPEKMLVRKSSHVHLDLSFQRTLDELQEDLQKVLPNEMIRIASIRTSSIAQAVLTGQNFDITAITPAEQPVSSKTTTWEWEVTPKSSGRHPLHLSIDAVVTVGPNSHRWTVQTFDRWVVVDISARELCASAGTLIDKHWQWLWATFLVPLGILAKRRWRAKKKG